MTPTNYANGLTNDFSADRSAVEKSLFDRINPQLDRDKSALENKLTNQGISARHGGVQQRDGFL
jgi:hypothetical protein